MRLEIFVSVSSVVLCHEKPTVAPRRLRYRGAPRPGTSRLSLRACCAIRSAWFCTRVGISASHDASAGANSRNSA